MTSIRDHQSAQTTKMLIIGDNGSGKTGALCSLAAAGYNVRVIDLDNGLDLVKNLLMSSDSPYPSDTANRFEFETITDQMKNINGRLVPRSTTVWNRAVGLLNNWKTESADFGPITTWGPKDVLVIDSLTHLANGALNFILSMNARLGQQAHQSDWWGGQQLLESMLQMLYDKGVGCNVIINCHIVYIERDNQPEKGYPASLGKALSPKIGSYFNNVIMAKTTGSGASTKHKLLTQGTALVELKNTAPLRLRPDYPIETGLAEIFAALRGESTGPRQNSIPAPMAKPGAGMVTEPKPGGA